MEISCKELRIGNWVNIVDFGIQRVVDVLCDSINTMYVEGAHYGMVTPIPLTPEILEKAEFKVDYVQTNVYESLDLKTVITNYDLMDGYFEIQSVQNNSDAVTYINHKSVAIIKYVHQLQNLYWCLVGKELVIEL